VESAPEADRVVKHPSEPLCRACGGKLPLGLRVKFCPHCGECQALTHCPECHTELDPSWRHCVTCGAGL
jgi:predicted amidophosphoribosyltransferase